MLTSSQYQAILNRLQADYTLFERHGDTYPLTVFRPAPAQINDVDSCLGNFSAEFLQREQFAIYDDAHLDALHQDGRTLTNGKSFVLDKLETVERDGQLKIHGKLGNYFDMLATCDVLDHELRRYGLSEHNQLPHRTQFHEHVTPQTMFYTSDGRCPIIGAATLLVFNHEGVYKAIVVQRSSNMATGAGLYHVMPAFVFQPSEPEAFYQHEWSMKHQIIREFGEELFGMPEYADWDDPQEYDYFYSHPSIIDLQAMLNDKRASMHFSGIAYNLLSLRAEICSLLIIHDADWYTRSQNALQQAINTERQKTFYILIDNDDAILSVLPDNPPRHFAPQGAAALWLGVELARELL